MACTKSVRGCGSASPLLSLLLQDPESLRRTAFAERVDVVVSCLASRTGGIRDSWEVDYGATHAALQAARKHGAKHFVLLSAICVQKPLLAFQQAKLKLEAALQAQSDLSYSIVRPTAFMKSLAGQVESCKAGGPYVMFGDGQLASCKPISEADLAAYMADAIRTPALWNRVLPIGGPGPALSALQQGTVLFEVLGQEPRFVRAPVALFDAINGLLDFLASLFDGLKDAAEFGKIGKYYAVESMLVRSARKDGHPLRLVSSPHRCRCSRPGAGPGDRALRRGRHAQLRQRHAARVL